MFDKRALYALSLAMCVATALPGCGGGGGGDSDAGNTSPNGVAGTDTTPPTAPGQLTLLGSASNSVQLSWTAASDNSGVTGYDILRNGQVVGSTSGEVLFYSDAGLPTGSSYLYTVRARDGQGNISPPSMVVSAVVLDRGDSQAPDAPTGLKQLGATNTSVSMGWTASV